MKPVKNLISTGVVTDVEAPRSGQIIGDRYRLDRLLERGAMGSVWRAEQIRLRVPVAVKFLDPSLSDEKEMHDRFIQEARSAAAVRSAHVVQVFDYGSEGGVPYIAMELLDGENLDARLGRGPLTPAELARVFSELARGIGRAHAIGVIHRDLKPGNIFIAREGEHEVTKIVDFGIAKVKASALRMTRGVGTQLGTLLGTPQYMSPEQVRGLGSIDHRSDLWSLGVIACECLTGRCPFTGATIGDLTVQICTEKPAAPSTLGPVPAGFDQWFVKSVKKRPQKRFQSAEEMAERLLEVLAPALAAAQITRGSRLISLPSRSEVRLAYSAVVTWKGQVTSRIGQFWEALRRAITSIGEALARHGEALHAGISRARLASGRAPSPRAIAARLATLRPSLERHGALASVSLLCCGLLLLGLTARRSEPVVGVGALRVGWAPPMLEAVVAAAASTPAAAVAPSTLAAAVAPSAPAAAGSAPAAAATGPHASAQEAPPGAKPAAPAGAAAPARGDSQASAPRSAEPASASTNAAVIQRPITMAMAQAAAKILTADELVASLPKPRTAPTQPSVAPPPRAAAPAPKPRAAPRKVVAAPRAAPAPPKRTRPEPAPGPFDDRL